MDSIDFELKKQLIKEKYPDKKDYIENLKLAQKIQMNSDLKSCTSNVFHIYDEKLMEEITKKGQEAIDKYKKLFGDSDECYVTKDALDKFNEMLNDGKHTREECYNYLVEEKNKLEFKFDKSLSTQEIIEKYNEMLHDSKHTFEQAYGWMMMEKNKQDFEFYQKTGMHLCNDYAFLYPESISSSNINDIINKNKNKHMEHYIEEYLNPNNDLDYSYSEIKEWVLDLHKQGKSIPEIKNYLMEKLEIFTDSEEQLIYDKLII